MAASLTITDIEVVPIVVPLAREYRGSHYRMTARATVIVRLRTREGIVGEAYAGDEDKTLRDIVSVIRDELAPRLVGEDAMAYERCWELGYPVTFDILRDRRIGLVALACVDLAIWDAIGKYLDMPLWQLWGGYRRRVPVSLIGGYYDPDPGRIATEAAEWQELGFRACKFKVGGASPDEDAHRVARLRESVGDGFVIMVDANQGYTAPEAVEFCDRVRDLRIRWFEEPCRWSNDRRDMRDVRFRGRIPVCAGQSEVSPGGCRDLMESGAIDVCNFDASWSGGFTAWRRVAALCSVYGVEIGHHEEPQVAAHLIASQPAGTFVECFHPDRDPIWWGLVANRPQIVDGEIALGENPGLGWVLDAEFIEHYRVDH
jgi:L-alanine-DL-glutamate epimerase-like enolase superfamily enzyme